MTDQANPASQLWGIAQGEPQMTFVPQWPTQAGWYYVTVRLSPEHEFGAPRPGCLSIKYEKDDSQGGKLVPMSGNLRTYLPDGEFYSEACQPDVHWGEKLPEVETGKVAWGERIFDIANWVD